MTTPSRDLFDNPEYLLRIWEAERKTRDLNSTLMWENIKYFGGFISGLLVAQMALYTVILNVKDPGIFQFAIFVLPVAIIVLSCVGYKDLKERRQRFLLVVTHLLKLEELLGVHEGITTILDHFQEDKYLFAEYQKNLSTGTYEDFIKEQMKFKFSKKNSYVSMSILYIAMIALAGGLILLDIRILNTFG